MYSLRRLYALVPMLLIGLVYGGAGEAAASSANISHSYFGASNIINGSLVSLDPNRDNYVQAANTSTANQLVGVAVAPNDSLVEIDSETNKVQVATTGVAYALVSDVNGEVKNGDQISVSPFSGIGMKAGSGLRLIGLAQSSLGSTSSNLVTREVTDKNGQKTSIKVGFVKVNIAIGAAQSTSDVQKNSIQQLATSLTGHSVSMTRIIISSLIAVVSFIALVTLIYTSIYGSIVAIGRNPLAKTSIFRALASTIGLVLVVSSVALGTIYLIIR